MEEKEEVSKGVSLKMKTDHDGLDTFVEIAGEFWVAGSQRKEFSEKLGKLIEKYRI